MGVAASKFKQEEKPMSRRPARLVPPAHLSKSPPVPEPAPAVPHVETGGPKGEEPTRYGDWENAGICRDF